MTSNNREALPEEFDLEGPDDDGWYHTKVLDWITLNPDINHPAFRLYAVMRSLCIEKRAPVRKLKIEELRRLVPGVNGKECSRTAVEDAIARLKRNGLIKALDSGTSGGAVRWRVNDLPPNPENYEGWRNTFDKLDAIRAEAENSEVNGGVPGKAGRSRGGTRKSGQGTRKSGQGTRKSGQGTRKSAPSTHHDQPKRDHQEPPQDPFQEDLEPTPRAANTEAPTTDDELADDELAGHEGGRRKSSEEKDEEAREFFASVPAPSAARKTMKPHMVQALHAAYWSARDDGHTPGFLRTWLSENLPSNIQSLAGLWLRRMENLPEPTAVEQAVGAGPRAGVDYPTDPCGQCDGRPGENWNTRVVYPNGSPSPKPCPECHPYGRTDRPTLRVVS